jgi:hypothetical protein
VVSLMHAGKLGSLLTNYSLVNLLIMGNKLSRVALPLETSAANRRHRQSTVNRRGRRWRSRLSSWASETLVASGAAAED